VRPWLKGLTLVGCAVGLSLSATDTAGWLASAWAGVTTAQSNTGCAVRPTTMTAVGCTILRHDLAVAADPEPGRWGKIDCAAASRYRHIKSGGDKHPGAKGGRLRDGAFRRLTVLDGDDVYGERCELGRNNHANGENAPGQTSGTFALYREGDRKITFFSQRYPTGFNTNVNAWQQVAQMKQAQPYSDAVPGGVALEVQIYKSRLRLLSFWATTWSTRAPRNNVWVRYALDVVYSTDPTVGRVKLYIDRNGDGDALDTGEQSPVISGQTLGTEAGTREPIPNVLMVGIYHDSAIDCGPPVGCSVDIDNIQVVG
jgi:hypothetical protein